MTIPVLVCPATLRANRISVAEPSRVSRLAWLGLVPLLLSLFAFEVEGQTSREWTDSLTVTGEVTEAGVLSVSVRKRVWGGGSAAARAFLRSPGNRTAAAWVRELAADLGLSGRMRDVQLELPDPSGSPLTVTFTTTIAGYLDASADSATAPIPFPTFALPADPASGREGSGVASGATGPRTSFTRIEIRFPESVDCCVPPVPVVLEEEHLHYRSLGRAEGNALVATRSLSLDPGALTPGEMESYERLRRVAGATGTFSVRKATRRPRISLESEDPEALATAGLVARREGRLDRSAALLERAVELRPDHETAWKFLGTTYLRLDRFADAEAAFRRQIEISPGVKHAYASLAMALDRQGESEEAEAVYRRQLELSPGDSYAAVGLASLLVYEGRSDEALPLLEEAGGAGEIDTGDPELQVTLGWTLIHAGHPRSAIPILEEVVASDSTRAGAQAYLGRALRMTDRTEEALPHLRTAVEIAPDRAEYRVDLARALWTTGEDRAALSMLREGRRRSPDHRALCMALGHTLTRLDRVEEAPDCSR